MGKSNPFPLDIPDFDKTLMLVGKTIFILNVISWVLCVLPKFVCIFYNICLEKTSYRVLYPIYTIYINKIILGERKKRKYVV